MIEKAHPGGAMRRIGWIPRGILLVSTAVMCFAAWMARGIDPSPGWFVGSAVFVGIPLSAFLLSLRLKVHMTDDALIVWTYLRTYEFRFDEVLGFQNVPYAGFFNRYVAYDNWLNFGLRMLEVQWRDGRTKSLPGTLCTQRELVVLVKVLNRLARLAREGEHYRS